MIKMTVLFIFFLFSGCGIQQPKPILVHPPVVEEAPVREPIKETPNLAPNASFDDRLQRIQGQVNWAQKRVGP